MAVELAGRAIEPGDHVVQFYRRDSDLARTVAQYVSEGLRTGASAIVIATEAHREAFEAALRAVGIDPSAPCRDGRLLWHDAAAMMAAFMPEGRIDAAAFSQVVGSVVRQAGESGRPVRAYGEMVALLWDAGQVVAAIELEELWNQLGREHEFSLLCAYHSESVTGPEHAAALQQVCHLHSAVWPPPDSDSPETPSAGAEVSAEFSAEITAPRSARHFVSAVLDRWGHDEACLEVAGLLVTELATNAVVHARSPFSVVARAEGARVRVSVRDQSQVPPIPRDAGPLATSGRGLRLVALLSADWGVDVTPDGKTVWAELPAR